ncbi:hypothetical protein, partial [Aquitalea magnusonii]|uniref:hypothetical protein n=1 Tax=Aquitalea magnusonii TaxID=332411 RepID=UPI00137A3171
QALDKSLQQAEALLQAANTRQAELQAAAISPLTAACLPESQRAALQAMQQALDKSLQQAEALLQAANTRQAELQAAAISPL